jgi:hypothetical protein
VVRLVRWMWFGSLPSAVMLATLAAAVAMLVTAAVSVLASDRVAAAADLYGPRHYGGKRCERAVEFPDACVVRQASTIEGPMLQAAPAVWLLTPTPKFRPLNDAVEVPEDFI